ncbi:MAG TPA: hypothetical protein VLB84_13755, partial [Bacteroidia bacterium]|nr:hypothetical protein [Bacteroidia bacterium]
TVGILMGLSKATAFEVARNAEYPDHFVTTDYKMYIHPLKPGLGWGSDGGLGTWADVELQKEWHGLTGNLQSDEYLRAERMVLNEKDLTYLHLVGDSWAHSYIENGERIMYGDRKYGTVSENEPWYASLVRLALGDITFEHARGGPEHGKNADIIALRRYEYFAAVNSYISILGNKDFAYADQITNRSPDKSIFEYIQTNGGDVHENSFLFKSFIGLKTGQRFFSDLTSGQYESLTKYLKHTKTKFSTVTFHNGKEEDTYSVELK